MLRLDLSRNRLASSVTRHQLRHPRRRAQVRSSRGSNCSRWQVWRRVEFGRGSRGAFVIHSTSTSSSDASSVWQAAPFKAMMTSAQHFQKIARVRVKDQAVEAFVPAYQVRRCQHLSAQVASCADLEPSRSPSSAFELTLREDRSEPSRSESEPCNLSRSHRRWPHTKARFARAPSPPKGSLDPRAAFWRLKMTQSRLHSQIHPLHTLIGRAVGRRGRCFVLALRHRHCEEVTSSQRRRDTHVSLVEGSTQN